jgi:hypothetical protein
LKNDWFMTGTLQYHVFFAHITALFMRLGIIEPAFIVIHIACVIGLHIAWRAIVVRQLGGTDGSYIISVVLYYLSAAGTGLGMYQFFQDSCVLPSNVANVALLWGIWLWLERKYTWAGIWIGIAGIFHLNHALVGGGMWVLLSLWHFSEGWRRKFLPGTLFALIPCGINVAFAAGMTLSRSVFMPLHDFIDLYVRFRHPHHYNPASWPWIIWAAFIWPAIVAPILLRGEARRIALYYLLLNIVALIGAGLFYVSETLVQMTLYRFCIYVQLFGCAAAAVWITRRTLSYAPALIATAGCAVMIAVCLIRGPFFGLFVMPNDDLKYIEFCRWVRQNTPQDAIFLVPPGEESMRFHGGRAIVVNYKGVPQLSKELLEWRQRLCDVMAIDSVSVLPHEYGRTMEAMRQRYEQLTMEQHIQAARKYNARFVVYTDASGDYRLYDVGSGSN